MCANKILVLLLGMFVFFTFGQQNEEQLLAELELIDFELEEDCQNLANSKKWALLENDFNESALFWQQHGELLENQSKALKRYEEIPFEVSRNWTVISKPGDALLGTENWNTLVTYQIKSQNLVRNVEVFFVNDTNLENETQLVQDPKYFISHNDYQSILHKSRNKTILKNVWSAWQGKFNSIKDEYASILDLTNIALLQNEKEDLRSYWEMLVDQQEAYATADALWTKIQPLYSKLHKFVQTRIFHFYNIANETSAAIPVYLLGSNFGNDWSYVADIVLPHPQIHYDAETFLRSKTSKEMYKMAESISEQMTVRGLGDRFWRNSVFDNPSCDNALLSFCSQEYTEVFTCEKTSYVQYLDACETALDVTLKNDNYLALSRLNLRYSAIDECIKSMGSTIAIRNLPLDGSSSNGTSAEMTKLLLVALRVLPKLPFYLAADKWRLEENEGGISNEQIGKNWWKFREEYQGVQGVFGDEYDFLGSPEFSSNQPFLTKFFGQILQFHLLDYYKNSMLDPNANIALEIGKDENFRNMIHDRPTNDWPYLVNFFYGFYELSADPLLEYFKPLEEYFESAPLDQQEIVTTTPKPTKKPKPKAVKQKKKSLNNPPKMVKVDEKREQKPEVTTAEISGSTSNSTAFAGLAFLALILSMTAFGYTVRKRRRLNNRRFEAS